MRLSKLMVERGLSRSIGEAVSLIKGGAIRVGGCNVLCTFFDTGNCACGGWEKVTLPMAEFDSGVIKVSSGNWRLMKREGGRFDQLPGVGRI